MKSLPELANDVNGLKKVVEDLKGTMEDLRKQIDEVGKRAGNFQQFGQPEIIPLRNFSLPTTIIHNQDKCLRDGKTNEQNMMLYCGCRKCNIGSLTLNTGVVPKTWFQADGTDPTTKKEDDGKN